MIKSSASNRPAIKKDIHQLNKNFQGFRSEFKSTKKSVFGQMLKIEERVEGVEDRLVHIEDSLGNLDEKFDKMIVKFDHLQNIVISFVSRVDNLETENTIGTDQVSKLRRGADDHEKRISKLEASAQ